MVVLLRATQDYWDAEKNGPVRAFAAMRRTFHRERNYAIVMVLLDSDCRIGEALSLKLDVLAKATVTVKGR